MNASDLLRQAQSLLADPATAGQAGNVLAQASALLANESSTRRSRIERERKRLMQAREVLTCLAVALDGEANVEVSDVVELVADIVLDATHGLDSVALKSAIRSK